MDNCCDIVKHCWQHAVLAAVGSRINKCIPGCCPVHEAPTRIYNVRPGSRSERTTLLAYILREHSFNGLCFTPDPPRPTDLMLSSRILLFFIKITLGVYFAMEATRRWPEWTSGYFSWVVAAGISCFSSFIKSCYKSGIKRTFYCKVQVRNLSASMVDTAFMAKYIPTMALRQATLKASVEKATSETRPVIESANHVWTWKEDTVLLPMQGDVVVFRLLVKAKKEIATGVLYLDDVKIDDEQHMTVELDANGGKLEFDAKLIQEERLTLLALCQAILRPITECFLLKCCAFMCCLPCCLALWSGKMLCAFMSRRKGKTKSKSGEHKPRGWDVYTLRVSMRTAMLVWLTFLWVHFFMRISTLGTKMDEHILAAGILFLKSKVLELFIIEPGAISWTYCGMACCCPHLIPHLELSEVDDQIETGNTPYQISKPLQQPLL